MVKSITALAIAAVALAAGSCFDVPAGRASTYGDAPWCIMTYGDDVHWRCEFRSGEECVAAVAGTRGSCNVNPYYSGAPAGPPKRGKR
jgi:Protein of unknown function (DUF3551)